MMALQDSLKTWQIGGLKIYYFKKTFFFWCASLFLSCAIHVVQEHACRISLRYCHNEKFIAQESFEYNISSSMCSCVLYDKIISS